MRPSRLPVEDVLADLRAALARHSGAVLTAPPGAGKSTVVPLALMDEPWMRGRKTLMLEPRRLAARAVARRMAETLGEPVGRTVGYRTRLETRVSRATRIEVVTEGVLTRMLQGDPSLDGVALVIFDEFHERSLQADLGLALVLDTRTALAPALRVLVMSATLEAQPVARLLGDAASIAAVGKLHAVETRFVGKGPPVLSESATRRTGDSAETLVARIVRTALTETEGDLLVFLPGAAAIRRTRALLEAAERSSNVHILALHGELDAAAQDAALGPAPAGKRKLVLATNIAETSLTIEGVRVVVDSGLARRSVFDPSTGMSRLETRRISRASAEQRQGRAGRTAPGVCYRAWSAGAHESLVASTPAEIVDADLAPLALELAAWGTADAGALPWLDAPPAPMLASARDLLRRLGALDENGCISRHGREMAHLAVHPRLAHMLLEARRFGVVRLGARLAALLSDRDLLRPGREGPDADVRTRLEAAAGEHGGHRVDSGAVRRIRRLSSQLTRLVARHEPASERLSPTGAASTDLVGVLLACAYPDRIGRRRPGGEGRYALSNGRGARFAEPQSLAREELIVAVDLDDRERDARIRLAAPLPRAALEEHFAAWLERAASIQWDAREQAVVARSVVRLGELVIDERPLPAVPADAAVEAVLIGVRELGIDALPWTQEARGLQARVELVRRLDPAGGWPEINDAVLAETTGQWLAPWLASVTRREHLARVPLLAALRALLSRDQQRRLEELAPTHLTVPSGSRVRIEYRGDNAPLVSVRLQEVFGLHETPRVGGGRVPLTFELLSPARRPVQITRDLASFWRSGYAEVRKDLRGRYPKHAWPEDPLTAEPTRGVPRTAR